MIEKTPNFFNNTVLVLLCLWRHSIFFL